MHYPHVLSEDGTVNLALAGRSIARFGDGELRIACGGSAPSQMHVSQLALELRTILATQTDALVCIPNNDPRSPRVENWKRYAEPKFRSLMQKDSYGSAFITRPDSAPWINRPDYWAKIKRLWEGQDVVLVTGEPEGSNKMVGVGAGAATLRRVDCMRQHAFAQVDEIEERIGRPTGTVILCLGATATVLAARLAAKDVHAIDLGHVGMFMRRAAITKPEGL